MKLTKRFFNGGVDAAVLVLFAGPLLQNSAANDMAAAKVGDKNKTDPIHNTKTHKEGQVKRISTQIDCVVMASQHLHRIVTIHLDVL